MTTFFSTRVNLIESFRRCWHEKFLDMKNAKITMPHRHTIRFESDDLTLDYEVEILIDGIVLYETSTKIIKGQAIDYKKQTQEVANWLKAKFKNVEIDQS